MTKTTSPIGTLCSIFFGLMGIMNTEQESENAEGRSLVLVSKSILIVEKNRKGPNTEGWIMN